MAKIKFDPQEIKRLFMTGEIIPLMTKHGDVGLALMVIGVRELLRR